MENERHKRNMRIASFSHPNHPLEVKKRSSAGVNATPHILKPQPAAPRIRVVARLKRHTTPYISDKFPRQKRKNEEHKKEKKNSDYSSLG